MQLNAFQNVTCKMVAILSQPEYVNIEIKLNEISFDQAFFI